MSATEPTCHAQLLLLGKPCCSSSSSSRLPHPCADDCGAVDEGRSFPLSLLLLWMKFRALLCLNC